jgi:hypothetical protein
MHLLLRTKSYPVEGFSYSHADFELPPAPSPPALAFSCSLPKLQREVAQEATSKKTIASKCRVLTRLSLESTKEMEFEKSLKHNKYTLNLSDCRKLNSLPPPSSLQKAHSSLVSEDAFEHFKRLHAVNGRYE